MTPNQKPTVGGIVHFCRVGDVDPAPLAAIIIKVLDDDESVAQGAVNLAVFGPVWGLDPAQRIAYLTPHETEYPGTIWTSGAFWCWPDERAPSTP